MNEPEVLLKLGSNIKRLRQKKNMTQIELATECNFEKASMSRIESGQTNATILTLQKISRALDVPLGDFFKESL